MIAKSSAAPGLGHRAGHLHCWSLSAGKAPGESSQKRRSSSTADCRPLPVNGEYQGLFGGSREREAYDFQWRAVAPLVPGPTPNSDRTQGALGRSCAATPETTKPITMDGLRRGRVVAWGGIEPPTRGFSIPSGKCSPASICSDTLYANQQVSRDALDADTACALIGMRLNGVQLPT